MSAYKLELEMRITDTVMGSVTADGVIKQTAEQSPESDEAYLQLLVEVKQSQ